MTTTDQTPDAPRVRAPGPGGFQVATNEGKGTPWWRLVGDNGEVLGHSQVYATISNARRGIDAAERTAIVNSHRAGEILYEVLRAIDAADAEVDDFGPQHGADWRGIPADVVLATAMLNTREQLINLAALAILWADALEVLGGTSLATLADVLDGSFEGGESS